MQNFIHTMTAEMTVTFARCLSADKGGLSGAKEYKEKAHERRVHSKGPCRKVVGGGERKGAGTIDGNIPSIQSCRVMMTE